MGCDPNAAAVRWAGEHLPGIEFFHSSQEPPLPLDAGALDAAFAVSVWSHFGPEAATRWLEEMRRAIRPGGALVLTAQGIPSLAHYLRIGTIDEPYAVAAVRSLLARGHHWVEAFGAGGDWGVESTQWGTAFMLLDWLTRRTLPGWSTVVYEPARVETNQDLLVLRRN